MNTRPTGRHVLTLSPGFACWQCEKRLPPGFTGVAANVRYKGTIYLLCSPQCVSSVLKQLSPHEAHSVEAPELLRMLSEETDSFIAEGIRTAWGIRVRIDKDVGRCREKLLKILRATNGGKGQASGDDV